MKEDITTKNDIEKVVHYFYEKVKKDDLIGHFFNESMIINWKRHIDKMNEFWENVLFYTGEYNGDPLNTHKEFHKRFPTNPQHFERWKILFDDTLNELFEGPNTEKMRAHAKAIADVMVQNIDKYLTK